MERESAIEQKVVRDAKKLGIKYAIKLALRTESGWPDRLFLVPGGLPVFIEFKRQGQKPGPLQDFRLRELRKLGYRAEWADNYDTAMGYLVAAISSASRPEARD